MFTKCLTTFKVKRCAQQNGKRSTAIGYYNIQHGKNTFTWMNILQNHLAPATGFIYCDWMLRLIKKKEKKGFHRKLNSWRECVSQELYHLTSQSCLVIVFLHIMNYSTVAIIILSSQFLYVYQDKKNNIGKFS